MTAAFIRWVIIAYCVLPLRTNHMADPRGFLSIEPQKPMPRPVHQRTKDYGELYQPMPSEGVRAQATRCMDCGIPFCHTGCPLGNLIPDWNDLVHRDRWREALDALHDTNNFPEFTGKTCPAPCEASCVLALNGAAVQIKTIECAIVDRGWEEGWIVPQPPRRETGKSVGVIGSGPAGMAAAQQLRRAGHAVTVYERDDRIGGLMTYGIPDFKMSKRYVELRVEQMEAEGVLFVTSADIGLGIDPNELAAKHDALLLAVGATKARDLDIPGRELKGIELAMPFLSQQNRRVAGDTVPAEQELLATGKNVIIIGGGDTAADCLGTCHRQGSKSVLQLDYNPRPPENFNPETPWPLWPKILRMSPAHEEGGKRDWQIKSTRFEGENGRVKALHAVRVKQYFDEAGDRQFQELVGSEIVFPCELVLLAIGFSGPEPVLPKALGLEMTAGGAIKSDRKYQTSRPGVYAAGDCRRGQSIVVWAIAEGREAARHIDEYLTGKQSHLPARDRSPLSLVVV